MSSKTRDVKAEIGTQLVQAAAFLLGRRSRKLVCGK